jgi:hypothetical protein
MFENAACEISRARPKNDVHFAIPSVRKDPNAKNQVMLDYEQMRLQFYFRVDGNRNNNWRLQMFAGGKNKISVFGNPLKGKKDPFLFTWTRAKSNGYLAKNATIIVNMKALMMLDRSINKS